MSSTGTSRICQTELCRKSCSAAVASVLSIVPMTPFEVIKTRMQAQAATSNLTVMSSGFSLSTCPNMCSPASFGQARVTALCPPECSTYVSTVDAIRKITRQEGLRGLWKGTRESLLMAVPMVGLYLPLYDTFLERTTSLGVFAPVVSGSCARSIALFFVAPLDILRTRLQALRMFRKTGGNGMTQMEAYDWAQGRNWMHRTRVYWRGYGATIARDVPFTAVYWGILEPIRKRLLIPVEENRPLTNVLFANSVAGASSGIFASAVTTPMDVVKTRVQIARSIGNATPRLRDLWKDIYQTHGITGFFSGLGPRMIRAAPACAIVLSSYEIFKSIV